MSQAVLGNKIAEIRRERGITQQELADGIGMRRTSLSQIENGMYYPSSETMLKISDFFQLPLGEIFFNPGVLKIETEVARREVI
ncbi:helix-turn-helix transcriptional regulator [Paenibacillus humicus]|uniref:helix-turn-helix transcriptional regulator n=1 Tax=Paenibacillus humicus TaxID=412861 RepID=UPI003F18F1F3